MIEVVLDLVKREDVDDGKGKKVGRVLGINGEGEVITREKERREEEKAEEAGNKGEGNGRSKGGEGEMCEEKQEGKRKEPVWREDSGGGGGSGSRR